MNHQNKAIHQSPNELHFHFCHPVDSMLVKIWMHSLISECYIYLFYAACMVIPTAL